MDYTYRFDLQVMDRIIPCRAFTLGEYEELIKAKLNGSITETVLNLIQSCAPKAVGLPKHWAEYVLVQLWARSLGEQHHLHDWVCSCGKEIPIKINFDHMQVSDESELIYKLKHLRIRFRYPQLFEDSNTGNMIVSCMQDIITDQEVIPIEELSEYEIAEIIEFIDSEDVQKIRDLLVGPQIQMGVPIECSCGNKGVHVIQGIKDFFKLI